MKPWTIMVYMTAHNDLDSYAAGDLEEMKQAVVNDSINVIAQVDWPSSIESQRLEIANGRIKEIGSAANLPSYKPIWLADFVSYCKIHFPAERYFLILWGHGSGIDWVEKANIYLLEFANDSAGNYMPVSELASALNAPGGMRFDLVGFDACLMNMVEVYYEIGNSINVAVGSADEIPKPGWPYHRILAKLVAKPEMSAADLAQIVVQESVAHYSEEPQSKVCFSAASLAWRKEIVPPLKELTLQLLRGMESEEGARVIVEARRKTQSYKKNAYADLYGFCSLLQANPEYQAAAQAVCMVLQKRMLNHLHSSTWESGNSLGLSICFPDSAAQGEGSSVPRVINWGTYKQLRLCVETQWDVFVKGYLKCTPPVE